MKDLVALIEQVLNSQAPLKKKDLLMLSQNDGRDLTSEYYFSALKHVIGNLKGNRITTAVLLLLIKKGCF